MRSWGARLQKLKESQGLSEVGFASQGPAWLARHHSDDRAREPANKRHALRGARCAVCGVRRDAYAEQSAAREHFALCALSKQSNQQRANTLPFAR